MLRLLLVRHGETDWNAQKRYQGHSNLPLNPKGIDQAHQLAARLRSQKFDLVFCSDLRRAHQTAEILTANREIELRSDLRLREMNFGLLEGHTFDDARERWPGMIEAWLQDYNQPPTGGERLDDFSARVAQFYNELRQGCDEKTVLLVAHGGPLREIIQVILGSPTSPALWINLDHASLSDFQVNTGHVIINRLNDAGHLKVPGVLI